MNIDQLPFNAFALESGGAAAQAMSKVQTLTVQAALGPMTSRSYAMSGSGTINQPFAPCDNVLRACVVPADGSGLTITF